MEDPTPATKDSDFKHLRFSQSYAAFQTQAASLVGLSRQFKELQSRWDSTESDLRSRLRELREREEKMEARTAETEAVEKRLEASKYHLAFLKPLIVKHEDELDELKVRVSEKKEECGVVERRVLETAERLERSVAEKAKEVAGKEVELRAVEWKIEYLRRECGLKEEEIEAKRRYKEEWEKEMVLIENRVLELSKREKVLGEIEVSIRTKERELDEVMKSIEEHRKECDVRGKQVEALEMGIEKCEKEMGLKWEEWSCKLEVKERELERLFERFELRGKQFEAMVEELNVIDKRVEECLNEGLIAERKLQSREKLIREREKGLDSLWKEVAVKKVELREVEGKIEDRRRECGLMEDEIVAKRMCMYGWEKEMEMKRRERVDQVDAMKILLREKGKECELIENRVLESEKREYYFGRCVEERKTEFEKQDKVLKEVEGRIQLKEMELDGVLKSIHERGTEFEKQDKVLKEVEGRIQLKETELDGVLKSIQEKECELKGKQVMALQMSIEKCVKEMELKMEERSCKLELKEKKQFEPIAEELCVIDNSGVECLNEGLIAERDLESREKLIQEREKSLDSMFHELKLKERHLVEGAKQLELKQTQFSCQVKAQELESKKYFTSSLNKLLEQHDQSLVALQMKIEAVKKLLEGKHEQHGHAMELQPEPFDSQLLGREVQHVLLTKSVVEFENQFSEFRKLVQYQIKHLDSLSHALHISERHVQGRELDLKLKHSDSEVNTESWELTPASDVMLFLNLQVINSTLIRMVEALSNLTSPSIFFSPAGIIQNLIEKKQLIKAVTFICNFKLIDKFPLVPLLKEYVEDARKSCIESFSKDASHDQKEKVVDDKIADLRALIQYIKDHSLESKYPPNDIMMEIEWLQELKEIPNLLLSLPSNVEKHEQKKGRKRSSRVATPPSRTYQLRKRAAKFMP